MWGNFCRELGGKILEYKGNQKGLEIILKDTVAKFNVFKENVGHVEKNGMEPFTFLALSLTIGDKKRKDVFNFWKEKFNIKLDVPKDFSGVPHLNAQKAGYFGDIDLLWSLFENAYNYPSCDEDKFFEQINKALRLKNVGWAKLTIPFFIINAEHLVSFDSLSERLLKEKGFKKDIFDYKELLDFVKKSNLKPFDISVEAYKKYGKEPEWVDTYEKYYEKNVSNEYIKGAVSALKNLEAKIGQDLQEEFNNDALEKLLSELSDSKNFAKDKNYKERTVKNIATYLRNFKKAMSGETYSPIEQDNHMEEANTERQEDEEPTIQGEKTYPLNQILYGPPGTGKTYNSVIYAVAICENKDKAEVEKEKYDEVFKRYNKYKSDGRIEFITFHQSYGYEEFIQGIKPYTNNGQIEYKVEDGVFKSFCEKAKNKQENFVFIIDEINRGNVSKIFGELITLIEESKRLGKSEGMEVRLPYKDDDGEDVYFGVPNNVYILGTMNTADRSLVQLDAALRRRFRFVEMMPNDKVLNDKTDVDGVDLQKLLNAINGRITVLIDREHQIGHSYFTKVNNIQDLKEVFENEIIPLLQEYFYEDYEGIKIVLGGKFVESEEKTVGEITKKIYTIEVTDKANDFIAIYDSSKKDTQETHGQVVNTNE